MAFADIETDDTATASSLASTFQQLSMSFGLACGSLVVGFYLADFPQTDPNAITEALHLTFFTLACLTLVSSLTFWALRPRDGESVSKGVVPASAANAA